MFKNNILGSGEKIADSIKGTLMPFRSIKIMNPHQCLAGFVVMLVIFSGVAYPALLKRLQTNTFFA
jgi:hypothetical protein